MLAAHQDVDQLKEENKDYKKMIKLITWIVIKPITCICNFIVACKVKAHERRINRTIKKLKNGIPKDVYGVVNDPNIKQLFNYKPTFSDRLLMIKFRFCSGIARFINWCSWRKVDKKNKGI